MLQMRMDRTVKETALYLTTIKKDSQGKQDLVFTIETWNGNTQNYVEQGDLPSISCPGDTIR